MSDELLSKIYEVREHLSRVQDRLRFGHLELGGEQDALAALIRDAQVALLQAAIDDINLAIRSYEKTDADGPDVPSGP
jgi:hypothetical protein